VDSKKTRTALAKSIALGTRLVTLWSLLFLYGLVQTIRGKFLIKRSIEAGVFLLLFIGIFGWNTYSARRTLRRLQAEQIDSIG
jgi:hypothetical protein